IFVLTGTAASQNAGPALVISMVIAAVACALAGLCYAELASMILVQLLAQTRIFFSMSRDGLLPDFFGAAHSRFRTPHLSTVLTGAVVAVAAGLLPIAVLSELVSMGSLLAFVLVCVGVLVLRRAAPDADRPFRVPGVPWVPVLGALVCLAQMASLPWSTWERLLVWLVLGLAIYFLYSRRRARAKRLARELPAKEALSVQG
ncbi:MAG: amino acid permease, partial [Gemmatimonadales bacterium]